MRLAELQHEAVMHVIRNMREADRQEIFNLRFSSNPYNLLNETMACASFAWAAWHDGWPVAVFGGRETHPGRWAMFMYATDEFPAIGLAMTRFCKRVGMPTLWEAGAELLYADSHEAHVDAQAWLRLLSAEPMAEFPGWGADGAKYIRFAVRRPVDTQDPTS